MVTSIDCPCSFSGIYPRWHWLGKSWFWRQPGLS